MVSQDTAKLSPEADFPPLPVDTGEAGEKMMTLVEHLDELRTRILRCLAALALSFVGALFFTKDIVRWLEAPAGTISFQALSLEEPLLVYIKVAFYTALVLAAPYLLFEISRFVAPGLKPAERKLLSPVVVGGPLLFAAGAGFAYFLILPPMLRFFSAFGQGISPVHQRLDFYISLVSTILLYMGLCFQLPLVIFGLSLTGLVNSRQLLSFWKYAVVGASLVAAIITPDPTAFSMLLVMAALVALYFFSILLLKIARR